MAAKIKSARAKAADNAPAPATIRSIKGFNSDMTCRGFKFEIGKTYIHHGPVKACESGFHACSTEHHPLSVFEFYAPAGGRFFEVNQGGQTDARDTKIASTIITIGVELSIGDLVNRAWDYVWLRSKLEDAASATGYQGAASATGDRGAASATGDRGAASATGGRGAASATGYQGAASATGYRGAASATGDRGAASATGGQGAASATGYRGAASATGYQGAASATGAYGIAIASGPDGKVMGGIDGITLVAREFSNDGKLVSEAIGRTGLNGVKPGVWYHCVGGTLVECD